MPRKRQDRLRLLVAAHLGAAAGGIALDEEQLVEREIAALAIGELAGQHGHARAPLLLDLLARALARLRLADDEIGEPPAVLDVLVEPELERGPHAVRDQAQRLAAVQPLLDLALELRIEHLGREDEAGAREDVLGHHLDALRQQAVHVDEALDGVEQAVLQARFVRAAGDGRDQVDVALPHGVAVLGEGDAPARALAGRDVLALAAVGVMVAFEERNDRVGGERLHQVVREAGGVEPVVPLALAAAALDRQRDLDARHQHRLAAQQVRQLGAWQLGALEVARIGPDANPRAALALAGTRLLERELLDDVAAGERDRRDLAAAPHRHLQPLRQRVGDADADAVQAAGKAVGRAAALVELAAGVQARVDDLDHAHLFFRMQADRNAAAVVVDA